MTNLAGVQAAAAATAAPREQRPNTHPVCATCGRKHAGGDDECWVVHPEKVPSSMKFMFKNIHTKRASLGLPDLREKYPVELLNERPIINPLRAADDEFVYMPVLSAPGSAPAAGKPTALFAAPAPAAADDPSA